MTRIVDRIKAARSRWSARKSSDNKPTPTVEPDGQIEPDAQPEAVSGAEHSDGLPEVVVPEVVVPEVVVPEVVVPEDRPAEESSLDDSIENVDVGRLDGDHAKVRRFNVDRVDTNEPDPGVELGEERVGSGEAVEPEIDSDSDSDSDLDLDLDLEVSDGVVETVAPVGPSAAIGAADRENESELQPDVDVQGEVERDVSVDTDLGWRSGVEDPIAESAGYNAVAEAGSEMSDESVEPIVLTDFSVEGIGEDSSVDVDVDLDVDVDVVSLDAVGVAGSIEGVGQVPAVGLDEPSEPYEVAEPDEVVESAGTVGVDGVDSVDVDGRPPVDAERSDEAAESVVSAADPGVLVESLSEAEVGSAFVGESPTDAEPMASTDFSVEGIGDDSSADADADVDVDVDVDVVSLDAVGVAGSIEGVGQVQAVGLDEPSEPDEVVESAGTVGVDGVDSVDVDGRPPVDAERSDEAAESVVSATDPEVLLEPLSEAEVESAFVGESLTDAVAEAGSEMSAESVEPMVLTDFSVEGIGDDSSGDSSGDGDGDGGVDLDADADVVSLDAVGVAGSIEGVDQVPAVGLDEAPDNDEVVESDSGVESDDDVAEPSGEPDVETGVLDRTEPTSESGPAEVQLETHVVPTGSDDPTPDLAVGVGVGVRPDGEAGSERPRLDLTGLAAQLTRLENALDGTELTPTGSASDDAGSEPAVGVVQDELPLPSMDPLPTMSDLDALSIDLDAIDTALNDLSLEGDDALSPDGKAPQ